MHRVFKWDIFWAIWIIGLSSVISSNLYAEIETFGAQADTRGPIGGGEGYKNLVTKSTYLVKSRNELLAALKKAKSGEVVYIEDEARIDLTFFHDIVIPGGVTLASGRGRDKSLGALIFTTQERTHTLFITGGEGVRVTGLRLKGPDTSRRIKELGELKRKDPYAYNHYPDSRGIRAIYPKLEVDNCELWGWSASAISLWPGASNTYIHHNNIHHNQRFGLGYGIAVSKADALIEYNLFDWNRHDIMSPGFDGSSYEACNNIVLENSYSHNFDVHGHWDSQRDRFIAGTSIKIHHNTFKNIKYPAIGIRGCPTEEAQIHHNWFLHITPSFAVYQRDCAGNMTVFRNVFGPDKKLVE